MCAGWWATHGSSIMRKRNPTGNPQRLAALDLQANAQRQVGPAVNEASRAAGSTTAGAAAAQSRAEEEMAFVLGSERWHSAEQPMIDMADSCMQAAQQVPSYLG